MSKRECLIMSFTIDRWNSRHVFAFYDRAKRLSAIKKQDEMLVKHTKIALRFYQFNHDHFLSLTLCLQ